MAKTIEELKELKKEYDSLTAKLKELTEEELKNVLGGNTRKIKQLPCPACKKIINTSIEDIIRTK